MPLEIAKPVRYDTMMEVPDIDEDISPYYLDIDSDYLVSYKLESGDKLLAKVKTVHTWGGEIEDVEGFPIDLYPLCENSRLYLGREFAKFLREWGIVKEDYNMTVVADKAVRDGEEIEIYTKDTVQA